jgi:uncharacterized protein YkwD
MKKLIILILMFSCNTVEIVKYQPIKIEEKELVIEINKERSNLQLQNLISEKLLTEIAKEKVEDMILKNEINHDGFITRSEKSKAIYFSENLAYGYATDSLLIKAYMNSKSHKENILNIEHTHVGNYTKNKYNCSVFAKY